MAFRHPYDPGLALPSSVRAEPPGNRGARMSAGLRRKTFDPLVPTEDGYAIPDYIVSEPAGQETRYSRDQPRKWIPAYQARSSLGDLPVAANLGASFGAQVADVLLEGLRSVPTASQLPALKLAFDSMEPGLWGRFLSHMAMMRKQGLAGMAALKGAIASATAEGFTREVVAMGQGQRPAARSLAGLGCCGPQAALGSFWSTITAPFKAVTSFAPVKWTAAAASYVFPLTAAPAGLVIAPKETAAIGKVGLSFAGKALDAVSNVACTILNNPAATVAAGGAAAAYGAPPQAGMAGAQIGQKLCAKPPAEAAMAPPPPPPPPPSIPWVPIALGGGALIVVLMATKKKRATP